MCDELRHASILDWEPFAGRRPRRWLEGVSSFGIPETCSQLLFLEIDARRWRNGNGRAERMAVSTIQIVSLNAVGDCQLGPVTAARAVVGQ